jgi:hypothetical protein
MSGATTDKPERKISWETQDPLKAFFTDRYSIDPSRLLKDECVELANKVCGARDNETAETLRKDFRERKDAVITDSMDRKISVTTQVTIKAAFLSLFRKIYAFLSGYVRDDSRSSTPLSTGTDKNKTIKTTCSGFAAMVIVESLLQLENDLKAKMLDSLNKELEAIRERITSDKYIFHEPTIAEAEEAFVKKYGFLKVYIDDDTNEVRMREDVHLFNFPFSKGTDLRTITPAELVELLLKSGAASTLPTPNTVGNYIR